MEWFAKIAVAIEDRRRAALERPHLAHAGNDLAVQDHLELEILVRIQPVRIDGKARHVFALLGN